MNKFKSLKIEIPMIESSVENHMRGGFLAVGNGGISVCGGPNSKCEHNSVCSDNNICYDNHDSKACSGNWGVCVSGTCVSTVTPTNTVTPTASTGFTLGAFI